MDLLICRRSAWTGLHGQDAEDAEQLEFPGCETGVHAAEPGEHPAAKKRICDGVVPEATGGELSYLPVFQPECDPTDGVGLSGAGTQSAGNPVDRPATVQGRSGPRPQ